MVAVLATIGLVVSLTALWPRISPGSQDPVREPGLSALVAERSAAAARDGAPNGVRAGVRAGGRADRTQPERGRSTGRAANEVVRTDASVDAAPRARPRPVEVDLSSIGVRATVVPVGVGRDGQVRLPPNPRVMGWYEFGPAPGATNGGSVVLAGHLDSRRFGLGPLVLLRESAVGDRIRVSSADGGQATYTVVAVERFDRQGLPSSLFGRSGPELLRVITCGGEYDAEAGGYQENLVVTAAPA